MDESSPQSAYRSDAGLISAIASGDAAAFAALRDRHVVAVRNLSSLLCPNPADADQAVADTFAGLHHRLREGGGPTAAVRPFLLMAVRWTAYRRLADQGTGTAAGPATALPSAAGTEADRAEAATRQSGADLDEPLFTDPDIAELVRSPLTRTFMSLPERQRAVLWHIAIERNDPGEAAVVLGEEPDAVPALAAQAGVALNHAYLSQYRPGRQDCFSATGALGTSADGSLTGLDEPEARQHVDDCPDCGAMASDLADLGESLRRVVAPVFLGTASAAYLSGAQARPGGLRWSRQPSRRAARAPRPRNLAVAGAVLLAFVSTGLVLALVATAAPQIPVSHPQAAATGPAGPAAGAPSASPRPAGGRSPKSASRLATSSGKAKPTSSPRPGGSPSPSPRPSGSPSPKPSTTPSPRPSPSPTPSHHHHHHPPSLD
jgi:DNA-directed RNA polymerase specialized sigma24 family protein